MKILRHSFLLVGLAVAALAFPAPAADAPKRVLVVTTTAGFRHSSIPTAERVLQQLADESKAFTIAGFARQPEVKIPRRPYKPKDLKPDADANARAKYDAELKRYEQEQAKWTPEQEQAVVAAEAEFDRQMRAALAPLAPDRLVADRVDAVIFANTTGDLPLPDTAGLLKWIESGHAFIGFHSASDTFHGFPAFVEMVGGEFASHGAQVGVDLQALDAQHPAAAGLPNPWTLKQEEIYLFKSYARGRQRDLWALDKHPNNQSPGFFPVAWCKAYGKGKVFYTSLGHREDLWDAGEVPNRINPVETAKQFQQHALGGIRWALGLAPGDATPQPAAP